MLDLDVLHTHVAAFSDLPTAVALQSCCREMWRRRGQLWLLSWFVRLKPATMSSSTTRLRFRPATAQQMHHTLQMPGIAAYHRFLNTVVGISAAGRVRIASLPTFSFTITGYTCSCPYGTDDVAVATMRGVMRLKDQSIIDYRTDVVGMARVRQARDVYSVLAVTLADHSLQIWHCFPATGRGQRHHEIVYISVPTAVACPRELVSAGGVIVTKSPRPNSLRCIDPALRQIRDYNLGAGITWLIGPVRRCVAAVCDDWQVRFFCTRQRCIVGAMVCSPDLLMIKPVATNECMVQNGQTTWC